MNNFHEKEIELAEGFLDDVTSFLITTYATASEDVRSGKSLLVMHRESDTSESIAGVEYFEIADLTLLFLNVFFTMKDYKAEIIIHDGMVNVVAEIDDLNGTIQLNFINQI